jgi:hypothetical protein
MSVESLTKRPSISTAGTLPVPRLASVARAASGLMLR